MTIVLIGVLAAAALGVAWTVRGRRVEALAVLIVSLPIVLCVPPNTTRWHDQLRRDYSRNPDTAHAITPLVILPVRNYPLEQQALTSVAVGETYAIVPHGRWVGTRSQRPTLTYLESWLQFQLAPRLQVDPARADWLILLDGADDALPQGTTSSFKLGNDVLVRQ